MSTGDVENSTVVKLVSAGVTSMLTRLQSELALEREGGKEGWHNDKLPTYFLIM